ncbi:MULTISPECIES: cation diffusion facilitator family transporter [unclassified Leucobacter]|uniref:cation diffusion facilitator family transporter n=1 Tax=unclassified Leucobacter TaxID=2621730 RepID=UPI00165DCC1C|nr:cation diffusion facilitator family transporter [Leucobacter sp. CX169]MBC9927058.1 cation transporter [Leucobacter sp. cx-169]
MGAGHHHGAAAATGGASNRRRLTLAFCLTFLVFLSQLVGSIITGSLALLVDTAHMLTDVIGLLLALTAARLMERPATDTHTWGFRRAEALSASLQALILLAVGVYAMIEGVRRLFEPAELASGTMLIFGIVGLVANVIAMAILAGGRGANLNMRAAFLEVVNDALGSVAVIVSALLIAWFGWERADSIAAILIAVLIVPRTISLLRSSLSVLLEQTPKGLDLADVRTHILGLPHVLAVHDLHITRISSDLPILTAHVTVEAECFTDGHAPEILASLQTCVAEHFPIRIDHATFQLEPEGHGGHDALHGEPGSRDPA